MKRTIVILFAALTVSVAMLAQEGSKSKGGGKGAGASSVLTGCLSGPNAEKAFVLTNGRYRKGVEVGGLDDLSKHVGNRVQLTGMWAKSGAEIGEKEDAAAEKKEKDEKKGAKEAEERHFKVTAIKHLADSCTAPEPAGAKAKGEAKGEGKGAGKKADKLPPK